MHLGPGKQVSAFWRGLAKQCTHTCAAKQPVIYAALVEYLVQTQDNKSDAMLRNRAMIITGFFGVRRGAEVVQFATPDVQADQPNFVQLTVRNQKMTRSVWVSSASFLTYPL